MEVNKKSLWVTKTDIRNKLENYIENSKLIGFGASFLKGLYESSWSLRTPTIIRELTENTLYEENSESANKKFTGSYAHSEVGENLGAIFGATGQTAGILYTINPPQGFFHNSLEFPLWTIPLATNTISGIYEFGREIYKKYKKNKLSN